MTVRDLPCPGSVTPTVGFRDTPARSLPLRWRPESCGKREIAHSSGLTKYMTSRPPRQGKGIRKPGASHASERIALGELIHLPRYQRRLRPPQSATGDDGRSHRGKHLPPGKPAVGGDDVV